MIEIVVEREADLSAEVVWEEMRHFDRVLNWVPGGKDSTISTTGHGIGMLRDIHLSTQGYVQHELVAHDPQNRTFSYKLTAGKPLGMQDYQVVATVTPIDENHCMIRWAGTMSADTRLHEEDIGNALGVALNNMLTGTIAHLKGTVPDYSYQPNEAWQLNN